MQISARSLVSLSLLLFLSGCLFKPGGDGNSRRIRIGGGALDDTTEDDTLASQPVPITGGSRSILFSDPNDAFLDCKFVQDDLTGGNLNCHTLVPVEGVLKEPDKIVSEISLDWTVTVPGERPVAGCRAGDLPATWNCAFKETPPALKVNLLVKDTRLPDPVPYSVDVDTGAGLFSSLGLSRAVADSLTVNGQPSERPIKESWKIIAFAIPMGTAFLTCPEDGGVSPLPKGDSALFWQVTGLNPFEPYRVHFCVFTPKGERLKSNTFIEVGKAFIGMRQWVALSGVSGIIRKIEVRGDATGPILDIELTPQAKGQELYYYQRAIVKADYVPLGCPDVKNVVPKGSTNRTVQLAPFTSRNFVYFCVGNGSLGSSKLVSSYLTLQPFRGGIWFSEPRGEPLDGSNVLAPPPTTVK